MITPPTNSVFRTLTGRSFELANLNEHERAFLLAVLQEHAKQPEWTVFSAYWTKAFDELHLEMSSPVYRIAQDLEARLGIAQGHLAPPDYRDYLASLIDERFGSRRRFCEETGIDAGHLSRVFAGRADLSIQSLLEALATLNAVLVIEPEERALEARASSDTEQAVAFLQAS